MPGCRVRRAGGGRDVEEGAPRGHGVDTRLIPRHELKPHEHVTVTLATTTTHRKVVKANASGVFKATFAGVGLPRCESYTVVARGNRGSLALLKIVQECPPPATGEQSLKRSARVSLVATSPTI